MKSVIRLLIQTHKSTLSTIVGIDLAVVLVLLLTEDKADPILSAAPWSDALLMICCAAVVVLISATSFYLGFVGNLKRRENWLSTLPIDRADLQAVLVSLLFSTNKNAAQQRRTLCGAPVEACLSASSSIRQRVKRRQQESSDERSNIYSAHQRSADSSNLESY